MKRIILVAAAAALTMPIYGNAGMYQQQSCTSSACSKEEVVYRVSSNYRYSMGNSDSERIEWIIKEACYIGPVEPINYRYKDTAEAYPQAECEKDAKNQFSELFEAEKNADSANEKRKLVAEQQEKQNAMEEQQKSAALEAGLRAGRVKPENIGQAAIAYNAEIGVDLASAPKVRPDRKLYALPGKIAIADDSPEFLAQISLGEQNDALFRMTGRSSEIDGRYFYVKIPKALQAYYFDQAKIERGFDLVGRYVANTKYKTIAGQQKSAPVFEAVYFVMWK